MNISIVFRWATLALITLTNASMPTCKGNTSTDTTHSANVAPADQDIHLPLPLDGTMDNVGTLRLLPDRIIITISPYYPEPINTKQHPRKNSKNSASRWLGRGKEQELTFADNELTIKFVDDIFKIRITNDSCNGKGCSTPCHLVIETKQRRPLFYFRGHAGIKKWRHHSYTIRTANLALQQHKVERYHGVLAVSLKSKLC